MELQTKIPLSKASCNLIDYESDILLLGSCFSDNIGDKLNYFKFKNLINPFGVLFQPKAIETLVRYAVEEKIYTEKDVFFHNEQWLCFGAHSKISHVSKEDLLSNLNDKNKLTRQYIKASTHVIITLGTAWVYRFKATNTIVANCHKIPQKQFDKVLLSVNEIIETLKNIVHLITTLNPGVSIIFTVSPIRHIKDGFIENTQSKSHLITAIHCFLKQSSTNHCFYFPSYEIMMDELRDYRFYTEDMIHPNKIAITYIWDKFKKVWIIEGALKMMENIDGIQKGILHMPFNPRSIAYQQFLKKLDKKKEIIQNNYPHIYF